MFYLAKEESERGRKVEEEEEEQRVSNRKCLKPPLGQPSQRPSFTVPELPKYPGTGE
jgi:hypothetical protein